MSSVFSIAEVLFVYGMVESIVGALELHEASYRGMANLFGHLGLMASAVGLCAITKNTDLKKNDEGYKAMMIGVHVGLVLPIVFMGVSTGRLYFALKNPAKAYQIPFRIADIALSSLAFIGIAVQRPKKEKDGTTVAASKDSKTSRSFFNSSNFSKAAAEATSTKPAEEKKKD